MLDKKYTKYIFLILVILNTFMQLSEKPIKLKNWLSVVIFIALYVMYLFNEKKKNEK